MNRTISRRMLSVGKHRSTTANIASLYPFTVQAPLPAVGPLLGWNVSAGGAPHCWDPFEAYAAGLVTNPNVFVLGEPGFAKSSLIKTYLYWTHRLYGTSRWLSITDPKGEYTPLATAIGMPVVRLAPGGGVRVNPLDGLGTDADDQAVQATMLYSITAVLLRRALAPLERKLLRTTLAMLGGRTSVTLLDVIALLAAPTGEMCASTDRTAGELVRDGEQVRFALDELCTGPLRGMFDGQSTATIDWDGPGVVIDLSGVVGNEQAMPIVMVAANAWARQQRHRTTGGRLTVNVNDEAYYQYKGAETVEFAQERRKLGRQHGEANIDICHRPSDLVSQTDDGTATAKMAEGLLADSATKIIFRQAPSELDTAARVLGLTDRERAVIATLGRGEAVWKLDNHSLRARHALGGSLESIVGTDGAMTPARHPGRADAP
jgi:hypothetical protein